FFFLIIARSLIFSLFPYTTLFRSIFISYIHSFRVRIRYEIGNRVYDCFPLQVRLISMLYTGSPCLGPNAKSYGIFVGRSMKCMRSEEHTSELQSLRHLVCRLLLEK